MNFLKSVFNSSSEFANAAGEVPPYNVIQNISKGNNEIEIYDCNYKYNNLKELEYICLHNGIEASKVNESLILSMIRNKIDPNGQIDQYGNRVFANNRNGSIDFLQSANNFIALFHNENINGNNNVMINILKVYDRFDSFVTENVDLLSNVGDLGENGTYLDYCILKLFRMILKNNYTLPENNMNLSDLLFVFIDKGSMNIKLYIEGLSQNNGKSDKTVFKLLNQRYPNINNISSLNSHLTKLVQKNEFIKSIEFINRVTDTSTDEITQLVKSLSQKPEKLCNVKNDELCSKMWQVGIIDKIIERYNYLKKENLIAKEEDVAFNEFEISFFKLLANVIEFDPLQLIKFDYIFLDYIKNNLEGKTNIITILLALNVCYQKFDETDSNRLPDFPLLLFNSLQNIVKNNKINSDENLNIARLFLLLLKTKLFNSKLREKFICNEVLRLVSEVSKQSGAIEAQNFPEVKSLNFLIVVLIVSLKETILSFYGSDRGYTILISAILQNKLIVTKLMPVQSLMNLLLLSNNGGDRYDLEPEVVEANRNIAQSAFDIYMHIISRVAKEGGFKIEDKSAPMFSEINKNITAVTNVDYYKRTIGSGSNGDAFNSFEIPSVVQYDDNMVNNFNITNTSNTKNNWSSWDDDNEEEEEEDMVSKFDDVHIVEEEKPAPKRNIVRSTTNHKPASSFANTAPKKSVLKKETRKIPVMKKKASSPAPKPKANAFPTFESDNEDGWGDDW
ncbi:hypothetical protein ACO0SA_001508 [Hanseniaspora valbyensis]